MQIEFKFNGEIFGSEHNASLKLAKVCKEAAEKLGIKLSEVSVESSIGLICPTHEKYNNPQFDHG